MHVIFDYFRGKSCLVVEGLSVMLTMVGAVGVRLRCCKRDMLGMFCLALLFSLLRT